MAFDLSSITKGKRLRAPKIVIYGPPKIGKSTFAASAPNAIGIITEEGLDNIDVAAFPLATNLMDVLEAITTLGNEAHDYQSVFVDSLDWLEPLIHKQICSDAKVNNIEEIGYGKGYIMADDIWRYFFSQLDMLRDTRGMTVICLAHEQINKVKNPALQEDYDAYSLKLNKRASAIISEWADVLGFAAHEVLTRAVDNGNTGVKQKKEYKALSTGARKLHINPHPAYVAGNRYSMPDTLLQWQAFQECISNAVSAPTINT